MFSLPQEFSSAAKSHLDTQLQLFGKVASTVLDGAEKVIALNLNAGKAALSHTAATAQHLLETQDPREFFSFGVNQAKPNIDSLLAYGRQLYGIASSTHAELLASAKARLDLPEATPYTAVPVQVQLIAAPAVSTTEAPAQLAPVIIVADEPVEAPAAVLSVQDEIKPAPLPLAASAPVAPPTEPLKLEVPESAVLAAAEATELPISRIKAPVSKTGPVPVVKGGKKR
ncbi:phasin family protein [Janthinobacterium aquaticum]|uniref:phasin family protein n=1 Tax=Janthinobacterium sp. FT58W TaxID=2654254 RepID=UPI0012642F11|nr:TIGR01841 family phasin [Janthinobacterium sp. FT58W]KAB8043429.1 phasin family protein [Janthinobacterium sp. FT58W]